VVDHQRYLPEFFEAVRARLMKGAIEYENRSFSKDPADLLEELRQEALDLAGWVFVLFCRLQTMSDALDGAARQPAPSVAPPVAKSPPHEPRKTPGMRIGGILGAMRETIGVHSQLLENLIGELRRVDAPKEPTRLVGADRGKLLTDPKDGLCL
jgi:hypothetical protein